MSASLGIKWHPRYRVEKWDAEQTDYAIRRGRSEIDNLFGRPSAAHFAQFGIKPYEVIDGQGNLLTTAGLTRLTSLLIAGGGQAITNTSARIGVGDGAGTAAIGDTDLGAVAGSTHRWFQIMDSTFPSTAGAVVTLKSTFASADGNFAWNEWGIDVGTPTVTSGNTVAALLFNHKTSAALGTKTSGSSWAFTVTVTFS